MATNYISSDTLTLDEALQRTGWTIHPERSESGTVLITDGHNFLHVNSASDAAYLQVTRYGANDPTDFVDALGMYSEHDPEYWPMFGDDDTLTEDK